MSASSSPRLTRLRDTGENDVTGKSISGSLASPSLPGTTRAASGRIGLSEYTSQRLAELRARRAEAESADAKPPRSATAVSSSTPQQQQTSCAVTVASPVSDSTENISTSGLTGNGMTTRQTVLSPTDNHRGISSDIETRSPASTRRVTPTTVDECAPGATPSLQNESGFGLNSRTAISSEAASSSLFSSPSRSPPSEITNAHRGGLVGRTNGYSHSPSHSSSKGNTDADSNGSKSILPYPAPAKSLAAFAKDDDEDCIGFASLPEQVHRKAVKRGFDFTLMVVGEAGLGKSTLISCLFQNNNLYKERSALSAIDRVNKTVQIEKKTMEIEERGVKLRLTVVDTPGFNDSINADECWKPISDYIDQQYEQYLKDESGINRKNIKDTRVHCCLYFLSPTARGLRQVDIELMKKLHTNVNIVPVIGKADTLTLTEMKKLKQRVLDDIEKHGIRIYVFPDCDSDEDEDFKKQDTELKAAVPFAVIGSNTVIEIGGKRVRGRMYPWGVVEVDNPNHSDFSKLRQFLISTHMQDLKDVTRDVHYENYRARHIQEQMVKSQKERNKLKRDSTPNFDAVLDADTLLQQKDEEIQQMREMLKKMQSQLKGKQTVGNGLGNL